MGTAVTEPEHRYSESCDGTGHDQHLEPSNNDAVRSCQPREPRRTLNPTTLVSDTSDIEDENLVQYLRAAKSAANSLDDAKEKVMDAMKHAEREYVASTDHANVNLNTNLHALQLAFITFRRDRKIQAREIEDLKKEIVGLKRALKVRKTREGSVVGFSSNIASDCPGTLGARNDIAGHEVADRNCLSRPPIAGDISRIRDPPVSHKIPTLRGMTD